MTICPRSCHTLEADQQICELRRDDDGETVSCWYSPFHMYLGSLYLRRIFWSSQMPCDFFRRKSPDLIKGLWNPPLCRLIRPASFRALFHGVALGGWAPEIPMKKTVKWPECRWTSNRLCFDLWKAFEHGEMGNGLGTLRGYEGIFWSDNTLSQIRWFVTDEVLHASFETYFPISKRVISSFKMTTNLGGGFKYFFIFTPTWGRFSILTNIFEMGGSTTN